MRAGPAFPWKSGAAALAALCAAGSASGEPAGEARCIGADYSAAAGAECGAVLQAHDLPMLVAVPIQLSDRQLSPDASPVWLTARRGRPLAEPLGGAPTYEVTFAAAPPGSPLALEFSSAPFWQGEASQFGDDGGRQVQRVVMRYTGDVESVQGWYLFAASDDEAIAWAMDRDASNARGVQYQEGRVDMGTQLGIGRDLAGFQMAVFLGEYEISTRHGSSSNDIIGFTLSRRR